MREDQNLPENEALADETPPEEPVAEEPVPVVEEPLAEDTLDPQAAEIAEDAEAELDPYDHIGEVEGEAEMRDMIGYIARVLVDDSEAVQVTSNWNDGRLNINLKVADDDKGKVIGRRGRVVHAMQSLLRVAATKSNMRASIDVE